jgi:tRNA G18 (ribose-2'-O)-methylase SpoU
MEISRADQEYILLIHDIRSVYNVGALFRTADAIGITRIVLSGYSPTPVDRFGRDRTDFAKSAIGSEKTIPWEYRETPFETIKNLKQEGFIIVGLEQDTRSIDYKNVEKVNKMVFILGTETTGMTQELLDTCDVVVEIPMQGMKESLNVSVAAGILLYRILDK